MRRLPIIIGLVFVLVVAGMASIFIVDERKQALVLQFGQVKQIRTEPGLYMKLPLIQDVAFYEKRILPLDTQPLEVTPLDERRLVVDAFARWRITQPVEFRQAVGTEAAGAQRLESILNASLREVLGSVPSKDVLSPERTILMTRIRDAARESARGLGVEIIDVRIRGTDLPEQNLRATFERMEAEREREAADERARGKERAQEIRATADRQSVELVSDAQRQSAIIRGQADAERNRIYAGAFSRDQEFFAFYRSLQAYGKALTGDNSTLVITPDSEFFDYLGSQEPHALGQGTSLPERLGSLLPSDDADEAGDEDGETESSGESATGSATANGVAPDGMTGAIPPAEGIDSGIIEQPGEAGEDSTQEPADGASPITGEDVTDESEEEPAAESKD